MKPQSYLDGLNERQKEAALHTEGPLLIIAGAGAGKTKTITHRIAHLIGQGVQARHILAVTFTNKAAGEMRERVRALVPQEAGMPLVATFHALGVRILREFHAEAGLPKAFGIWDRDDSTRALKRILEGLDIAEPAPRAVLSAISRQKGEGVSGAEYAARAQSFRQQVIARAWDAYEKALREEGALDFDDLLGRTLSLLQEKPAVLESLRRRWTYITIDEYQDTNGAQYEIARLLAGERKNLCVVGDIDQNIYSWRGADIEHLLSFEESFPGTRVILLEQNYRSTRTILAAANAIIAKNVRRKEKNLFTENETGEPLVLYAARNEIDEAYFVAEMSRRLIEKGTKPSEIAVLYRENFQSRALEEAFLAAGIPYHVLGTRFFERKEVKDALSYLRAALNPQAKTDLVRAASSPARGIGKVTLDKIVTGEEEKLPAATRAKVAGFREILARIKQALETLPASEAVRFAIEASGLGALLGKEGDEGHERLENLRELVNLAVQYDYAEPPQGALQLLEEAALHSDQDDLKEERGASLLTVHSSKGLEFDAVFVTGMEQGLFPSTREGDPAASARDPEEERRLFYVALTRARKHLFLSYARERMRWGSREYTLPSEFLDDIDSRLLVSANAEKEESEHEDIIR